MSPWLSYLAPGDQRARDAHLRSLALLEDEKKQREAALAAARPPRIDAAHRVRRKNAMFYGGIVFMGLSVFVTRRSLARKRAEMLAAQTTLPLSTPSTTIAPLRAAAPAPAAEASKVDASLDAVSALGLATLNVFSFAMLAVGSAMQYFDLADLEDVRSGVNRQLGNDVEGGDAEGDREIETWIAEVLARKDEKEVGSVKGLREGVVEKIAEMEERKKQEGGR
ncbi:hypothetical protein LTR09_012215 [Extremus antarcticus]|uniref:Altered inheritance of mitochondria protein 11 n=1 Tax=Extremus antarcticus TaxID=702011 RepID=A0AAJ0DA84_9PEZI|nr:hypothetical protein LTR09_012215 [Extremus antarcticus]